MLWSIPALGFASLGLFEDVVVLCKSRVCGPEEQRFARMDVGLMRTVDTEPLEVCDSWGSEAMRHPN